jgi:alkanesulfonate monooxygenase SsuD/methylene tetrahydromethanopterin reductase-like flavin-dependent oxidoreductase (luciferase family)
MKIGVELRPGGDASELFADARAFEAAGADSVWVRGSDSFDPWAVLAALAAVTWRVRLVVFAVQEDRPIAQTTVQNLSRGRLLLASGRGDAFAIGGLEAADERWALVDFPEGRTAWKELRARHEAEGTTGLVLQNDPRLLDLIRNPDVEDDRQDLKLAFG